MTQDAPSGEGGDADRRLFLTRLASLATAAGVTETAQSADAPPAAPAAGAAATAAAANSQDAAYQLFGQDEAAFVEALVNVMCPADALTPNGVDCGIATYIDRQLAGAFGQGAKRYTQAPFKAAKPEFGYQLALTPAQFFQAGIEATNQHSKQHYGKSFDQLAAAADARSAPAAACGRPAGR